jgi:hypothetical protein
VGAHASGRRAAYTLSVAIDSLYLRSLLSRAHPVRVGRDVATPRFDAVPHDIGVETPRAMEDRILWQYRSGSPAHSGTMTK